VKKYCKIQAISDHQKILLTIKLSQKSKNRTKCPQTQFITHRPAGAQGSKYGGEAAKYRNHQNPEHLHNNTLQTWTRENGGGYRA